LPEFIPGLILKGPRALIDRKLYKKYMRQELDAVENLTLLEGSVADLLITAPDSELGATKSFGRIQGITLGIIVELLFAEFLSRQWRDHPCIPSHYNDWDFLGWGDTYRYVLVQVLLTQGLHSYPAGRVGEPASTKLSQSLKAAGFHLGRLKTGTPPRLAKRSIDFSKVAIQKADDPPLPFSYMNQRPQISVITIISIFVPDHV